MGEKRLIVMKKKFYEYPEFLIFEISEDIVTVSGNAPYEPDVETEDNDWGGGLVPF